MRIFRSTFIVGILLFTVAVSSRAQVPELINDSEFRPDAKAAIDSMYNFNMEGAEVRLSSWKEKHPDHPLWMLIEGMQFWWQVLSDLETTRHDEQLITMMKKVNYQAGKLLHQQPRHADGLIIKAISNGYLARHHANRSEWLTSINYGRTAMNAYQNLEEEQPKLADLKLAEGLKLYYTAYLPEEYPIVKTVSWAMPTGDREKGLDLIQEASEEAIFASAEATYFMGNINSNYEGNLKVAVENFEKLHRKYPNNSYYARILVKSYYRHHQRDEALEFINSTIKRWRAGQLPYLDVLEAEFLNWKGRILDNRGKEDGALECYRQSLRSSQKLANTKERSFYTSSGYLAGKLLYDQQKFEEAKSYLTKVSNAKVDNDYREYAQDLLSKIDS